MWHTVKGTLVIKANGHNYREAVCTAAELLRQGKLVAFPTETVYGLGASALDEEALKKVFRAKGRPMDNPFIIHICHLDQLQELTTDLPDDALRLAADFWPGPLTLVCRRSSRVPLVATAGLQTVAVRMPDHSLTLDLLQKCRLPLVGPSANLSGRPSPTTAHHVLQDLAGRISAVLDGGPCPVGLESTVLDLTTAAPRILRPGAVTREQLARALGKEIEEAASWERNKTGIPPSPGLKYRHYAPKTALCLVEGEPRAVEEKLKQLCLQKKEEGMKLGLLLSKETAPSFRGCYIKALGSRSQPRELAQNLYTALRELDEQNLDFILAEGYQGEGVVLALMNRLRKAAAEIIKA